MQKLRNLKHIFFIIVLSLVLLFWAIIVLTRDFLVPLNYFFIYRTGDEIWQDTIYKHQLKPSKNIVIVEIDEETINTLQGKSELQMLSIPKKKYSELVEILERNQVKAIGFDIVFQNKDSEEAEFVKTLEKYKNITIGIAGSPEIENDKNEANRKNVCISDSNNEKIFTCEGFPRSIYKNIKWGYILLGDTSVGIGWNLFGEKKTIQSFENNVSSVASERRVNGYDITKSTAGRKIKFAGRNSITKEDSFVFTLPLAMVQDEDFPQIKKLTQSVGQTVMQPFFHEERNAGNIEKEQPYTTISMIRLLQNPNDFVDKLKDAYVLVGESGKVIHDKFVSPVSGYFLPGVYSHAFFLDGILQDKMLLQINRSILFGLVIIITIISVLIYFFIPKFLSPIFAIASIIGTIFIARYGYDNWRIVIDIFPLLLASSIISYPITYIYKFFVIDRDKRLILNTFSRYLNPKIVKKIDTEEINVTLGGENKELSIFFSDIAGFTSISEKMETKDLFFFMTRYLSKMTNILIQEGGTLDKYIGDAVMGFFGAPVEDQNHATHACRTAILMRKALIQMNQDFVNSGMQEIDFRVGIATGDVMVGNIGSEDRFNYTVLGDTVNLASRLEAIGKEYNVSVVIAGSTRVQIGDEFLVRELDYIAVKGKENAVRIFELLGTKDDTQIDMAMYSSYASALKMYRDGKYLEAGQVWEKMMEIDPPSKVMAYRCVELLKGNMTLDNGIYRMTHK